MVDLCMGVCVDQAGPDLSLLTFVWESVAEEEEELHCHLAVFDLNRWYHAQMPNSLRWVVAQLSPCVKLLPTTLIC